MVIVVVVQKVRVTSHWTLNLTARENNLIFNCIWRVILKNNESRWWAYESRRNWC